MSILLSLGFLFFAFGASLFLKRRSSVALIYKYVFFSSIILIFILLFYQIREQFLLWQSNPLISYLIPPYQDIGYFLKYAFFVFFAKSLIGLLTAIIFLISAKFFNKKFQERFFEEEEPYFGALSIFLVGYPGWIFYLLITLTSSLAGAAITKRRFSAYYLWFPIAIFVIITINIWLKNLSIWQTLKI